ncbi:hypothetical protein Pla8534_44120 [Lignipirellula cremea]|uniref:Uncharacterized protein n=1 Tax=Lignipirellula cremea TaxID=2528010 RepID=A0A518DXT2_9BACT|nr:hypothetical protein Pla8534_44120 [Lignipirellula cremea]
MRTYHTSPQRKQGIPSLPHSLAPSLARRASVEDSSYQTINRR